MWKRSTGINKVPWHAILNLTSFVNMVDMSNTFVSNLYNQHDLLVISYRSLTKLTPTWNLCSRNAPFCLIFTTLLSKRTETIIWIQFTLKYQIIYYTYVLNSVWFLVILSENRSKREILAREQTFLGTLSVVK